MRKIILFVFVGVLTAFTASAQLDTAVNRLKNELSNTANSDKKISLLKELIDRTVLIDEEGCINYINQAIFLTEETRDRKKMADIRLHAARAFLTQGGKQSLLAYNILEGVYYPVSLAQVHGKPWLQTAFFV